MYFKIPSLSNVEYFCKEQPPIQHITKQCHPFEDIQLKPSWWHETLIRAEEEYGELRAMVPNNFNKQGRGRLLSFFQKGRLFSGCRTRTDKLYAFVIPYYLSAILNKEKTERTTQEEAWKLNTSNSDTVNPLASVVLCIRLV